MRVEVLANGLEAACSVDMCHCWNTVAFALDDVRNKKHVGTRPVDIEVSLCKFFQDRRRKRTECLAMLDLAIEDCLVLCPHRAHQNAPIAQRPGSHFGAPIETRHNLIVSQHS